MCQSGSRCAPTAAIQLADVDGLLSLTSTFEEERRLDEVPSPAIFDRNEHAAEGGSSLWSMHPEVMNRSGMSILTCGSDAPITEEFVQVSRRFLRFFCNGY